MTATREDCIEWEEQGIKTGAKAVIIMLDTFDFSNYPIFVMPEEDVEKIIKKEESNMQKLQEIINIPLWKRL